MKSAKDWFKLVAKGFAMGTADLVPGVSGGTIAFITGIYSELISTIAGLGPATLKVLFSEGISATWKKYNLSFLAVLFGGIISAVLTLSRTIKYFHTHHPEELRAFFLGLVIASVPLIVREVERRKTENILMCLAGVAVGIGISLAPNSAPTDSLLFIGLSGAIAISAMLLPGISGSFILLLLGIYPTVIEAIAEFDIKVLGVFVGGMVLGLLAFSRLLKRVLETAKEKCLSLLVGFMVGALGALWPWQKTGDILYTKASGEEIYEMLNVLPSCSTSEIIFVVAFTALGAALVTDLDEFSQR